MARERGVAYHDERGRCHSPEIAQARSAARTVLPTVKTLDEDHIIVIRSD
jgi:hypothetical protein